MKWSGATLSRGVMMSVGSRCTWKQRKGRREGGRAGGREGGREGGEAYRVASEGVLSGAFSRVGLWPVRFDFHQPLRVF